jgi:hypothetical protein
VVGRLGKRQVDGLALSSGAELYSAERTSGWQNVTRSPIASSSCASAPWAASGRIPSRWADRQSSSGSPTGSAAGKQQQASGVLG